MAAAVGQRVGVELAAVQVARLLAAPAELLVPIVRRARGERGVALVPGLVAQGSAVLVGLGVRALRGRGRSTGRAALVYGSGGLCALAPLVGLRVPGAVAEHRSPLWGVAAQALMTVPVSAGIAVVVIRTGRVARAEHRAGGPAVPDRT